MKKLLLVTTLFIQLTFLVQAQTLTSADFPAAGKGYVYGNMDTDLPAINLGKKGSGNNWDFSSLTEQYVDTDMYISPSSMSHAEFPTATSVMVSDGDSSYFSKTSDQFSWIGVDGDAGSLKFNQPLVLFNFSPSVGIGYHNSSMTTSSYKDKFLNDSLRYTTRLVLTDSVDASGSLKTWTATYNVLRVVSYVKSYTYTEIKLNGSSTWDVVPGENDTSAIRSYMFYANGIGSEVFHIDMTDTIGSDIDDVRWYKSTYNIITAGLLSPSVTQGGFKLYPNPSSGAFTIDAENLGNAKEIIISDVLGNEVYKSGTSGTNTQELNVKLPTGLYNVKIVYPNGSNVRKLSITN